MLALVAGLQPGQAVMAQTSGAAQANAAPMAQSPGDALASALKLAAAEDWEAALAVAPAGIARDLVTWQWLRAGEGKLGDYEEFLKRRADWPGLALLRRKGEAAVARSNTPSRVVAWFDGQKPHTPEGLIALVRARLALGQRDAAEIEAMEGWVSLSLTPEDEAGLRALVPDALASVDNMRLEALLWEGRRREAERMLDRVPADVARLARVRLALMSDTPGVDQLLAGLSAAELASPGIAYERFTWRMRRDLYESAAELLISMPADKLGRPEAWAPRRALLSRWLLRNGDARHAYRAASGHGLSTGAQHADLEFLAGFIALRKLNDPVTATRHFTRLRRGVSTAISVSRADYWLGRAAEAQGLHDEAEGFFREAARHQTAYYGLLAAERLGMNLDPALIADPAGADWRGRAFATGSVLTAGRMLMASGNRLLARQFLLHLAEDLGPVDLAALGEMALRENQPHIALSIAKQAAERGIILPRIYYPIVDIVPDGLKVSRALALAIARRESEFEPMARSGADARGLMQVIPETAERMARELGLEYALGRLYDPDFNTRVGSAYLARMIEEFGPSIALVASGYNAGPGRPRRWIGEIGDPRTPGTDIIDWVETVPIAETRTYVMRVVEGVVLYRARLKGKGAVVPVRITPELRGR